MLSKMGKGPWVGFYFLFFQYSIGFISSSLAFNGEPGTRLIVSFFLVTFSFYPVDSKMSTAGLPWWYSG